MTIFRISFVRISEIEMKTKKGKDMTCEEVLEWLAAHANPEFREGMVRFGIDARLAVGVRVVDLRRLAREIGRDHALALELYRRPVHEGRILASMIADPALFRPEEMDAWVAEFRSWDLCDQCCINLFRYTSYAYGKVREYAASDEEFTRRAGFALLATLAVGDKRASDDDFRAFLPLIERGGGFPRPDRKSRELGPAADRQTQPGALPRCAGAGPQTGGEGGGGSPPDRTRCGA